MAQQAQALADEDLTQLRTYANAVAVSFRLVLESGGIDAATLKDERKILAQLSGMQEQVNGHVSEIDHQSYRTQYEVALLEDKSREVRSEIWRACVRDAGNADGDALLELRACGQLFEPCWTNTIATRRKIPFKLDHHFTRSNAISLCCGR